MSDAVLYGKAEYRKQGGEIHRRPADREGLTAWEAAWLVLNREGDYVPPAVRDQLSRSSQGLRFD